MAETTAAAAVGLRPLSKMQTKSKRRLSRRFTRRKVLKMLAVMEPQRTPDEPSSSHSQEFLTSGRTGRRNALPDILSEHAVVSSADLPGRLQLLSTSDTGGAGTSAQRDKTDAVAGPSKPPPSNGGS